MHKMIGWLAGALLLGAFGCGASYYPDVGYAPTTQTTAAVPQSAQAVGPAGYTWIDGYWNWNGFQWQWQPGHYTPARPGYVYVTPKWEQHNGTWVYREGGWQSAGVATLQ
jgi:hypothetical protein